MARDLAAVAAPGVGPGAGPAPAVSVPPASRAAGWRWGYPAAATGRDLRIDFLRGLAILFVVVDHIAMPSVFYLLSHERIGNVSGAELFVTLSGVVLGMVYRRRAAAEGWGATAKRIWGRARVLYLVSLAVMASAYALSFVPGLDARAVTTWTDPATGAAFPLYPTTPGLAEYPVPAPAVVDVLFLNVGPSQVNVLGLYVVLLLGAPLALRLLLDGRWWLLVGGSLALYAANRGFEARLIPSQFESAFPLLSWQLLFALGMTAGFHWPALLDWFDRPAGRLAVLFCLLATAAFAVVAWSNPWTAVPFDIRLRVIPEAWYAQWYETLFGRTFLGPLRVVNVAVLLVAAYALLSALWRPIDGLFGWLLAPLGGATLYVFILHVYFALLAANIPALHRGNVWLNTLAHALILLALWVMVKREVLFRWIPR